jgi:hypothetical protein
MLAHRGTDYAEVDAGSGYGTTISFYAAPVSLPYQVAVDFGVMSITDNDAIGAIENLAGAIKKIAVDLADVAGTSESDYYSASPSEIERRTFGDKVLTNEAKLTLYDTVQSLSVYTKTKYQEKTQVSTTATVGVLPDLSFSNLVIGKTYRVSANINAQWSATAAVVMSLTFTNGSTVKQVNIGGNHNSGNWNSSAQVFIFVAQSTSIATALTASASTSLRGGSYVTLEELPNHEATSIWT